MSIVVVAGTRPELVKVAGILEVLGPRGRLVHTGQHYDATLWAAIAEDLGVPAPARTVDIGGRPRGRQIGDATSALTDVLAELGATCVIVQGDTNSALAGALAANALELPLVHVEAGLRSFDRAMPEEHNRVVIDHLADLLCAPTDVAADHLAQEGIAAERVVVTGNTVVEAVRRCLPGPVARAELLDARDLVASGFVLATFHRPENVDDPEILQLVLKELGALPLPVVLPLHPRTRAAARAAGLEPLLEELRVVDPLGYREFLGLAAECAVLVSDSGGLQEEASVLKRPVVVVRRSTERPEVLGTFSVLARPAGFRSEVERIIDHAEAVHARLEALPCPYGDGDASARTVVAVDALLERAARSAAGAVQPWAALPLVGPSLAAAPAASHHRPSVVTEVVRARRPAVPKVSVIIPTLNEARNLPHVFANLPRGLHEVLVVDGRSSDDTERVARVLRRQVRVIHETAKGKGAALRAGFAAATGDILVTLDADGSTDPRDVDRFVQTLVAGADFAKGTRMVAGAGSSDFTLVRRLGCHALNFAVNVSFNASYTDINFGYSALWRDCLPAIDLDAIGFEVEALVCIRAAKSGLRIAEVPSFEAVRVHGESKLHAGRDGLRVLRTIGRELVDRRHRAPHAGERPAESGSGASRRIA